MFIFDENDDEMYSGLINNAPGQCGDFSRETLVSELPRYAHSGTLQTQT